MLFLVAAVGTTGLAGLLWWNHNRGDTGESMLFAILYQIYTTPVGFLVHQKQLQMDKEERLQRALEHHSIDAEPHTIVPENDERFIVNTAKVMVRFIPFLKDNYAYLLICKATGHTALVDPADPVAAQDAFKLECQLQESQNHECYDNVPPLKLVAILTTHYHWDHAAGNVDIKQQFPNVAVYGGKHERLWGVSGASVLVEDNDVVTVGDIQLLVTHTPGHTAGHVIYSYDGPRASFVFTGDHIFQAGTGRFFESSDGRDMYDSLTRKLEGLPSEALVLCGHEYALSNLQFAKFVDPTNEMLLERLEFVAECRSLGKTSLATTLQEEREINPFIRLPGRGTDTLWRLLRENELLPKSKTDSVAVLLALRKLKDLNLH